MMEKLGSRSLRGLPPRKELCSTPKGSSTYVAAALHGRRIWRRKALDEPTDGEAFLYCADCSEREFGVGE
jgi:hypothetical protein